MLGTWRSHADYQALLIKFLSPFWSSEPLRVEQYANLISKLYILDLVKILPLVIPRFSFTGRPSNQQPEIFRSFIAMLELGEPSIAEWHNRLSHDPVLSIIIGIVPNDREIPRLKSATR